MGPSIQWVESYVTADKLYCVYIAPNEACRARAREPGWLSRQPDIRDQADDRSDHRRVGPREDRRSVCTGGDYAKVGDTDRDAAARPHRVADDRADDFPISTRSWRTRRSCKTYDFRVESTAPGECTLRVPFVDALERPGGIVSGMTLMGAADVAMWLAIMTLRGVAEHWVTSDMKTAFLRSAREEDIACSARILKSGRRTMYGTAECRGADGQLVAHHVDHVRAGGSVRNRRCPLDPARRTRHGSTGSWPTRVAPATSARRPIASARSSSSRGSADAAPANSTGPTSSS